MKGVSIFSDIFWVMALLGTIIFVVTFIYYAWLAYGITSRLGQAGPREINLQLFIRPVEYNSALSALLETHHQGVPIKTILNAVATQKKKEIYIYDKKIDAEKAVLENLIIDRPYLLKTVNPEVVIAQTGDLRGGLVKITTQLFAIDGTQTKLEFYVG